MGYAEDIKKFTRSTSPTIYFGLYDVTAKDDAHPSAADTQPFTSVNKVIDNIRKPLHKMGTLEANYFKLDGSFETPPDDLNEAYELGWWSKSISGADGRFHTPPQIQITFLNLHSSWGIELFFDPTTYCRAFKVTWQYNGGTIHEELVEGNNKPRYFIDVPVTNYNRILIDLLETDKPFRFAKITEVNFGGEEVFTGDDIISATIIEEVDPTSGTLSMNKLRFTVLNQQQKFNMINPRGIYQLLQTRQPITAHTSVQLSDGSVEEIDLGMFYLSDWKNSTGLTATLEATDVIGLLDRTTYYSSPFWNNEPIESIVGHILADAGLFPWTISPDMTGRRLTGYIPVGSHRKALQEAILAARGAIRVDRRGYIEVYSPRYDTPVSTIDSSLRLGEPAILQKTLVSTVEATEYVYVLKNEVEVIQEAAFTGGVIKIPFDGAFADVTLTLNGGTLVNAKYSATAAVLTLQGSGTLTLKGKKYDEKTRVVYVQLQDIPAGSVPQVATLAENKLFTGVTALQVASRTLEYFQKRVHQTVTYWNDPYVRAGDYAEVETMFGGYQGGLIERQEMTFAPSLKSKLEVIG